MPSPSPEGCPCLSLCLSIWAATPTQDVPEQAYVSVGLHICITCMSRDSPMSVHVTFFTHAHTRDNLHTRTTFTHAQPAHTHTHTTTFTHAEVVSLVINSLTVRITPDRSSTSCSSLSRNTSPTNTNGYYALLGIPRRKSDIRILGGPSAHAAHADEGACRSLSRSCPGAGPRATCSTESSPGRAGPLHSATECTSHSWFSKVKNIGKKKDFFLVLFLLFR
jgi:hypothetical protein